nr:hypothetical protein [Morchella crassipes]
MGGGKGGGVLRPCSCTLPPSFIFRPCSSPPRRGGDANEKEGAGGACSIFSSTPPTLATPHHSPYFPWFQGKEGLWGGEAAGSPSHSPPRPLRIPPPFSGSQENWMEGEGGGKYLVFFLLFLFYYYEKNINFHYIYIYILVKVGEPGKCRRRVLI